MSNMLALLAATGGGAPKLYADDVFQSYTRTGTSASTTVTTGIDMTKGYTLHSKGRSGATDHAVYDSARGVTFDLVTNTTAAQTTQATGLTAVSTTGHTLGALAKMNTNAATYVDWIFREAAKFHKVVSVVKSAGSNATVDLSSLGTVGMVKVKRTDSTGSWYVWHRSLTAGKLLIGETTAAEATLGHITVSGTTLTLVNGVIADGTYHVEAYAHDTGADSLIQCGSFTTDGSGNAAVNLGWEPQYLLGKSSSNASAWLVHDVVRGTSNTTYATLNANDSSAESAGALKYYVPTATGFSVSNETVSRTYIFMAIRRPNKPPTSGTQVYNAIARTGTGAAATVTGVGFAPDLVIVSDRNYVAFTKPWFDRLRGAFNLLRSNGTNAEQNYDECVKAFENDGILLGTDAGGFGTNNPSGPNSYINHFFRRAPGFMDVVCYTGTGVQNHGLGVVPEMVIYKPRGTTGDWGVDLTNHFGYLNTTAAFTSASVLATRATSTTWNPYAQLTTTWVAYLFASLAGISKCGSYTGTAATLQINCGFTAGARFVLIKRTDAAGDWYVWDSVRGIVAGNDPYLLLNSTAAEVTTTDYIDPYAAGFELSSAAPAAINASGGNFIFLAIS